MEANHTKEVTSQFVVTTDREGHHIVRAELRSSNLISASYRPALMTLEIEFKGGGRYRYKNVGLDQFAMLLGADSPGSWFHANIKKFPMRFPFENVTGKR